MTRFQTRQQQLFGCLLGLVALGMMTPPSTMAFQVAVPQTRIAHATSTREHQQQQQQQQHRHAPLFYSNTAEPPLPSSDVPAESSSSSSGSGSGSSSGGFTDRMRQLLVGEKQKAARQQKKKKQLDLDKGGARPSYVRKVETLHDYKRYVADEQTRLTVVRFYAPYCRACKAATPAFYRLARHYPAINWVQVPVDGNTAVIHQGLGVPSIPYGHIYHPAAGLVEERRISKPRMKDFAAVLDSYVHGECPLEREVDPVTERFVSPYKS